MQRILAKFLFQLIHEVRWIDEVSCPLRGQEVADHHAVDFFRRIGGRYIQNYDLLPIVAQVFPKGRTKTAFVSDEMYLKGKENLYCIASSK